MSLAVSILMPLSAIAETRLIRWSHPDPSAVDGFRVLRGTAAGDYLDEQDVGNLVAADGIYSYSVELLDASYTHVAVLAYNADGASLPSNPRVFISTTIQPEPPPATPPAPPAPPAPPDPTLADGARIFPPVSGTLLTEDFSEPLSSEWLQTGESNSLVPTSGLFDISGVVGTNALSTRNEALNIHAHFVPDGASDWSDYELRGRFYTTSTSGGVGVTVFSDYSNTDSYYRLRRIGSPGAAFELSAHPDNGATPACDSPSTGVVPSPNAWYLFRVRAQDVGESSFVEAKVWRQGESEPATWQAQCYDVGSQRRVSGSVGVWSMGAGLKAWDDLEVVPVGDTPTPPLQRPEPPTLISIIPVE